jgi:hypothetical protein
MRLPGIVAFVALLLNFSVSSNSATAHPGGLNAEGCHNNRKTGEYHCHRTGAGRPSSSNSISSGASYRNCSAARAAGAAPIYRGQPGYAEHLDRDRDGVACEPYRGR